MNDRELLDWYIADASAEAFVHLVRRYGNLVFRSALRQTNDPPLA